MLRNFIIGIAMIAAAVIFGQFGRGTQDKPAAIPPAAPGKSEAAPRQVGENVVAYTTGDAAMNAAKRKARATLPRFHELIAAGTSGTYAVKFPLTQNGATEHIWLQLTGFSNGTYTGLLADRPVNGNQYRMGDRMEVAEADVEDWMVNDGSTIYGGYTARVALKDMPKEDAARYQLMFQD
jgi:uncharacterized protein YegJ (DUF2314 family)